MSNDQFDLIVIGGGPGGYVAAIRAAQLGMRVALIEREHLGGICLNWGCIPTKSLLRCSEVAHILHNLDLYCFTAKDISFDLKGIVRRSRDIAKQLSAGIAHLLKKNNITFLDGHGKLAGISGSLRKVEVSKNGKLIKNYCAKHIILATGARANTLAGIKPNGKNIVTYKEAMSPDTMPKKLLIIGSGAIGMEFASFYSDMGVDVTVIESIDRILHAEDAEISAFAMKQFIKQGIKIYTSVNLHRLIAINQGYKAEIELSGNNKKIIEIDRVLLAIGIIGNVENIGLENTKIKVEKTHVVTNEWFDTGEPGVYAIGDLVGPPWLAHKASHEAVLCVEKIAGLDGLYPINARMIPNCTYTRPQIASIGLTEGEAKKTESELKIGRFPCIGNGKAIILGQQEGIVKTIFSAKTGELLGAHMIGAEVTELIHSYGIAMNLETTETELMHTIFPHPTLSEMIHESILHAYSRAIHF
ncbi:dihydrolipoyl dehydrogenase [Candidatus Endolissoclinum faulkneri L5]|uniref:Dihydrolipoyl dehydrogenase n=1 Tax=Candidatus Endolissoclinum faulkneri L5 TaxID=1401328 RepID=V9TVA2_9PROT|nr:dihydrolipoyl dehydrogenase [Candidatus Endolissoclinum faulkneri]AHC73628.1 dihydrolipoyl dehydrogenase [Candidatus Endolissoclinum faulkneri L5]